VPAGALGILCSGVGAPHVTLAQMSGEDVMLETFIGWQVRLDSDAAGTREGMAFDGHLGADTAVVLTRA